MSEEQPRFMSQAEMFGEYAEKEQEEQEKIKEERLKEKGIELPVNGLSDSIHPKTQASYNKLKLEIKDTVRFASQRPDEYMKRMMHEATGKPPKITTAIRKVYRLKDAKEKEWLCYLYNEFFDDLMGNKHSLEYTKGAFETVEGEVRRDTQYRITGSKVTNRLQNYDIPFTKKNLEEILKKDNMGEDFHKHPDNKTEYIVGYTSSKPDKLCSRQHPLYSVKNQQDFIEGSWADLYEMGRRGLSKEVPSIHRLKQPVSEDPPTSLPKRERGYIPATAISYVQSSLDINKIRRRRYNKMTNRIIIEGKCPSCGQPSYVDFYPFSSKTCQENFNAKTRTTDGIKADYSKNKKKVEKK